MHASRSEIKYLRSLSQKKVRDAEKKFIVEGWKSLQEAVESDFHIEFVGIQQDDEISLDRQAVLEEVRRNKIAIRDLSDIELRQISETVHSQGVIALVHQRHSLLTEKLLREATLIVALDRVSDPGNVGSIIRTCDWFDAGALLLGVGCVSMYNEKVVRSTAGSIFHLTIAENIDLVTTLKDLRTKGFSVVATALDGKHFYPDAALPEKTVIVLGSEGTGISDEIRKSSDLVLGIPRFGNAESLNVGVACGITLFYLRNQSKQ